MFQETITLLGALLAFGLLHSILAAIGVKALFVTLLGQRAYLGLYRLFYNSVSVITLAPIAWLLWTNSGEMLWEFSGALGLIWRGLQGIGLIGLLISLLQIDLMRFLGLSQLAAYLNGAPLPLPPEPLSIKGVYALVRHPLYLFSLMLLWFTPQMSAAWLGLSLGSTLYFGLGSWFEERKMLKQFGADYARYQGRVPWMIPFLRF